MSDQEKEYTARRRLAQGSITRLVKFADRMTDNTSAVEISNRLELLERAFTEFVTCESQLGKFDVPSELADYEQKYLSVKAKLKENLVVPNQKKEADNMEKIMSRILRGQNEFLTGLSESFTTSMNQTITQSAEEPHVFARLPKLNVPNFFGDYKEFPSFKDLYVSSVHSKLGLNDVEKFQYLKGYLRGEAASLVRHITVSGTNYQLAWEKICERYDKKRHVLNDFIKTFMDQPVAKAESVTALRTLHNTSDEVMRGITALGEEASGKDPWLIYLLLQKFDQETKQAWAHRSVGRDFPKFEELLKFLSERCDALETCEPRKFIPAKPIAIKTHQLKVEQMPRTRECCSYCQGDHRTYTCELFKSLNVEQRRIQAASRKLCFNCLANNHLANRCSSKRYCTKCKRRHHTLLHTDVNTNISMLQEGRKENTGSPSVSNESTSVVSGNICGSNAALLPTAVVMARTKDGHYLTCKLLLDSGSQLSFISEKCINRLGLRRSKGSVRIEGLATSNVSTTGKASVAICSRFDTSKTLTIKAYTLPKITSLPTSGEIIPDEIEKLNLPLADPNFQQKKEIDILLGADYFFYVLGSTQHILPTMVAQETLFGYVISRKPTDASDEEEKLLPYKNCNARILHDDSLEMMLLKFWEQEEVFQPVPWSKEDQLCENHFMASYQKINGRFIVQLPIKPDPAPFGQSYNTALQRLMSVERKRSRNLEFNNMYLDFMREYEALGHMRKLTGNEVGANTREVFYLPHHGVLRTDSATTKLRVVFDGSASSSNGTSLNDNLLVGPSLQDTLWAILLRFRTFKVAICGDIEKMYRQILVDPANTSLQRILWRESSAELINQYELLTVTYGTASAPFLAIRVLFQIASDCEERLPDVAAVIRNNFYVDDVLTGADDEATATKLKYELTKELADSGLVLRKWRSNRGSLGDGDAESQISDEGRGSKLLGLFWNPIQDTFSFKVAEMSAMAHTKRTILSIASQIFDPLGWLSPFTINSKIFLQNLWLTKLSWDDPLPSELHRSWQQIQQQFGQLKDIHIPRFTCNLKEEVQFHGFSDASELAYSAAVYIRTRIGDTINVNLLTAKSKVAPMKQVSLPRLELCGSHLLARLLRKVLDAYHLKTASILLWIDSTVVLSWLSTHPRKWKTYVANRVAAIHQLVPEASWGHVKGTENPADLATRGISAKKLVDSKLWWKGPEWLNGNEQSWPLKNKVIETLQETRAIEIQSLNVVVTTANQNPVGALWERISTWSKLVRIMAYVRRFVHNKITSQSENKLIGHLTVSEITDAETTIIKVVQKAEMNTDFSSLRKYSHVPANSRIASLAPFIDSNGLLRVGGRLENTLCTYDMKHPVILPKNHIVTRMIVVYLHLKFLHPGPSLLLGLSRHQYWILGGRELCRSVCHKCITCFRYSTLKSQQQMGNLPESRITPSRPFSVVGVDYAGPILLASKKGRGARLTKGFLVIFVCFATKALHIEVASELTTEAFLAALDRFVSRRGAPTEIHSDNGTNFVGANRKLQDYYKLLLSKNCQSEVNRFTTTKSIQWKFIPPIAPHFGGIWERAVRSVKTHLVKVTGKAHLTFEEMTTVMTQIEGILNSRPLCTIRNEDVCNIDALTPSHFLTLGPITALPHANYVEIQMTRLNRWERVQKIVQQFWKRYSLNYLNTLQQRHKWQQKQQNLEMNDIVLMHDSQSPPCAWSLGRVIDLHTGRDGLTRVATIQTKSSKLKRAISKLFKLPFDDRD